MLAHTVDSANEPPGMTMAILATTMTTTTPLITRTRIHIRIRTHTLDGHR